MYPFSEFAGNILKDSAVPTLGCERFRGCDNDFGTIDLPEAEAIPRLTDMGQCDGADGTIQVAIGLAKAFDGVANDPSPMIALSRL